MLLHELGHKLGLLPADGEDADMTRKNNMQVFENCFGG